MKLIQTITVGAGGITEIEFTSIPQTYTDLLVKLSARTDSNSFLALKFNTSGSNFSGKLLQGDGSSAATFSRGDNFVGYVDQTSYTANTFSNTEIFIPNYTGSTNKSFSLDSVAENNGTEGLLSIHSGLWSQTSAITGITIALLSGGGIKFVQYSTASLYGITKGSGGATAA